jgi:uncharacterized protein (DUF362 family)
MLYYRVEGRAVDSNVYYASAREGVSTAVGKVLEAVDARNLLPAGMDILLKVNLTWDFVRPGVDTSPWVVEAVASHLRDHVGRIWLGESSQVLVDATRAFGVTGMREAAERQGLIWHNFSEHDWVPVRSGDLEFSIPEICTRMPVVSVPVVKTHYRTTISAALKNLYGCLDDNRHNYHCRLSDYLTAVNDRIPVVLTVADGTVSLEGNGPKPGTPRQTDFVAASTHRVAMDQSLARLMGFDPRAIESVARAAGVVDGPVSTEDVALPPLPEVPRFSFTPPRPNFVARVERRLRGSRDCPGSDGPLMGPLKRGARLWYRLAYRLTGQDREAARWIESCPYGPQWAGRPEGAEAS